MARHDEVAYPYKESHVLLLLWVEDDLGFGEEVDDLATLFSDDCNFTTAEIFKIP
jgi:hypothetical protein